jgi:hypothetical protein
MATVQHSRPATAWECDPAQRLFGSARSSCQRSFSGRSSDWLVDPQLKTSDTLGRFEFFTLAFSVAVMLGGLLWHSGRIDGVVRILTSLARRLAA